MEHELSAVYDITHGHGLAILSPRWLEFCMDDETTPRIARFGITVFGLDPTLPQRELALRAIDQLSHFLFDILGLKRTLPELNIDESHFDSMAAKAVLPYNGTIPGFRPLTKDDVVSIYRMCM